MDDSAASKCTSVEDSMVVRERAQRTGQLWRIG